MFSSFVNEIGVYLTGEIFVTLIPLLIIMVNLLFLSILRRKNMNAQVVQAFHAHLFIFPVMSIHFSPIGFQLCISCVNGNKGEAGSFSQGLEGNQVKEIFMGKSRWFWP